MMYRLSVALAIVLTIAAGAASAESGGLMKGRIKAPTFLYSDSLLSSKSIAELEPGDKLTLFPEMSTDEFFFAMAENGKGAGRYGWVPSGCVQQVDAGLGDVPVNHWAGEAVRRLKEEGILEIGDKGFQGDRPVSRYEMAVLLDRHLDKLQQYKADIMAAIEAIPYDRTLDAEEAGRLDRLIHHLEGLESTEKELKRDVARLEKKVDEHDRRLDVVEEATATHDEAINKMQSQIASLGRSSGKMTGVLRRLASLEKRLNGLEKGRNALAKAADNAAAGAGKDRTNEQLRKLAAELQAVEQRLERLETAGVVANAAGTGTSVTSQDDSSDFDISEADFDMNDDETPELEEPAPRGRREAEAAHDALRAALRKGLVIKNNPLGDGPQVRASASDGNVDTDFARSSAEGPTMEKRPDPKLVRALARKISEIGRSLENIDSTIDGIEAGML